MCVSVNINGLQHEQWKAKNERIKQFLKKYDFDIIGLQEVNLNWDKIGPVDQWDERTIGWWKGGNSTIKAYNQQDVISKPSQPGGCMVTSVNKAKTKVVEHARDFRKLGRWAWTRYRGKNNKTLRVVSAYRPGSNAGAHTVYSQQRSYFDILGNDRQPKDIMLEELRVEIVKWQDEGDLIVVMIDANEHVDKEHMKQSFETLGLREAIIEQHKEDKGYQATYNRGREPIDGIFVSEQLQIEAAGYLPFGDSPSDHRALWIRINEADAFGYAMEKLEQPQARRLTLEDPRVVRRWIEVYKAYLMDNRVIQRAFNLQVSIDNGKWNKSLEQEYEILRRLRKKGIKLADSKCRKLNMGEVPWSMTLQSARDEIELWNNVMSRKRGTRVSTRYISRLEKRVGIFHSLQVSLQVASTRLQESYKRYYELKSVAQELRESWLMELAAVKAKEAGGDQHKYYSQLIQQERDRIASRRMRRLFGKMHGGGLTKVTVTQPDGTIIEHTEKEAIEQACHKENSIKFSQTEHTPTMAGILADEIGFDGTSEVCRQILDGTYIPPPGTNDYTKAYLQELKRPQHLHQPPQAAIPTSTFKDGWKKINEHISSGLSGIHFGHMKACGRDDTLANFEATMCHIPFATGYSPDEWKTSINCMIEKKGKGVEVENLRTINLMESDFNFNNKVMGRTVSDCAERNKLLPKEQYGSRQQHQARHHGINKRLTYDLAHFQRRPMIVCSNDAKSCYDRIVHSIASMAMQRLGLPLQPIQCMITTIQDMDHYIRTGFGDSDTTMSGRNSEGAPFQGILQGNGSGPVLWLAVSTPLIEMMRTQGHGIKYRTPMVKRMMTL